MQHPSNRNLQLFAMGQLDAEQEKSIKEHLAQCPECEKRVSDTVRKSRHPSLPRMRAADDEDSAETMVFGNPVSPQNDPGTRLFIGNEDLSDGFADTMDYTGKQTSRQSRLDGRLLAGGDILGGHLRLEEKLGRGGMGEAWKASDLMAERNVVVKLVPPEIRNAELAMEQVRETFQKVHALQHQHICPMMNLIDDPSYGVYVVMKFINGKTLDVYRRDYIAEHGRFPASEIIRILWDVARALDYSHERKVLHRDVKPQNIMVSPEDGVQLIDFGLAAEIRSSLMQVSETPMDTAGTRPYMAPEQWRGRFQDAKTDQYALAVTAYELIAGHKPFQGEDVTVLRECVLNEEPEPIAGIADSINAALLKALAKKREDRFPDCKSFIKALAKPQADGNVAPPPVPPLVLAPPVLAPPPLSEGSSASHPAEPSSVMPVKQKTKGFNPWLAGTVFGAFLLAGLAFFLLASPRSDTSRPPVIPIVATEETDIMSETPIVATEETHDPTETPVAVTEGPKPVEPSPPDGTWPRPGELDTAPAEFRQKLKEAEDEIKEKGGFAVAGRVFIDGKPAVSPTDFDVALNGQHWGFTFNEGWFLFPVHPGQQGPMGFRGGIRVFGRQTGVLDTPIIATPQKVDFFKINLQRPTEDKLIEMTGRVVTEDGEPLQHIRVSANGGMGWAGHIQGPSRQRGDEQSFREMMRNRADMLTVSTNSEGKYRFPKLYPHHWRLAALIPPARLEASPDPQNGYTNEFVVHHNRKITIDAVYQPNGSTDFDGADTLKKQYTLSLYGKVEDTGRVQTEGTSVTFDPGGTNGYDLRLNIKDKKCFFHQPSSGKNAGIYDLGDVDFDSVTAAIPNRTGNRIVPCELNHIYVVRTYEHGHYAKFIVRSIDILKHESKAETQPTPTAEEPKTAEESKAAEEPKGDKEPASMAAWVPTANELGDAPAEFLKELRKMEDEIKAKGGFVIAGQIFIDGKPPESPTDFDVRWNRYNPNSFSPCPSYHFDNGWFLIPVNTRRDYQDEKMQALGVQADTVEMPMKMQTNAVNFVKIKLQNAPDDKLVELTGRVITEDGKPIKNANVSAGATGAYFGGEGNRLSLHPITTDDEGKYCFPRKVFPHSWAVNADDRITNTSGSISEKADSGNLKDIVIFNIRKVAIDTVYQPDGSTDFTKGNVITGRYVLLSDGMYTHFRASGDEKIGRSIIFGPVKKAYFLDLLLGFGSKLSFGQQANPSGLYSLGEVDFDSVKEADPKKIQYRNPPCELNHVYVVRTNDQEHYAKFVVRSIEVFPPGTKIENNGLPQPTPVAEKPKTVKEPIPLTAWKPTSRELSPAPAEFRKKLRAIEDEIKAKGGCAVAGQVFIDGKPAKLPGDFDVKWNGMPSYHFNNGWFVFPGETSPDFQNGKIQAWGVQTDIAEMSMKVQPNTVNFVKIELQKAPDDQLVDLTGRVMTEDGKPFQNALVSAWFPMGGYYGGGNTLDLKSVTTNGEGKYYFPRVFPHPWSVSAYDKITQTSNSTKAKKVDSGNVEDIVIFDIRKVVIDTMYQPDGSTDFTKDNMITGRYTLFSDGSYINDTAKGDKDIGHTIAFDPTEKFNYLDLKLEYHKKLQFSIFYFRSEIKNGYYSLGEVDFDSVKTADPDKIQRVSSPCGLNHVYVVRTCGKGHYAKFVVRSIEILTPGTKAETNQASQTTTEAAAEKRETPQIWYPTKAELAIAPEAFLKRGKEIEEDIKRRGGYAVAGQVTEKNGMPIRAGTYTVVFDEHAIHHYDNGWYISEKVTHSKDNTLTVTTFRHDGAECPVEVTRGKINFQRIILERVPDEQCATLVGIVQNEKGYPIVGAKVTLSESENPKAKIETTTDLRGYSFTRVKLQDYDITVTSSEPYSGIPCAVRPRDGKAEFALKVDDDQLVRQDGETIVTTLLFPRKVTIDVVLQPDGSTDFTNANARIMRQYELLSTSSSTAKGAERRGGGIIFDTAAKSRTRDLSLEFDKEFLFCCSKANYTGKGSGCYVLGEVDFDSVKEAEPEKIQKENSSCKLNHVYVVKTHQNGKYAKFIVRSIEVMEPKR